MSRISLEMSSMPKLRHSVHQVWFDQKNESKAAWMETLGLHFQGVGQAVAYTNQTSSGVKICTSCAFVCVRFKH